MNTMSSSTQRSDRMFFSCCGLWFVVLSFVGFAPTFYLRALPDPLPTHLIVHGLLNTGWVLLFLTQALLIARDHRALHMALGGASIVLLPAMLLAGFHVVLLKTAAGMKDVDEAGFNLTGLTLATAFAAVGLIYRRRPFVHKRLMLFATLVLTVAAADRVALVLGLESVRIFRKLLAVAPALAVVGYDAIYLRRLPVLSLSLLALVWLFIWYLVTDLLFLRPAGAAIIQVLTPLFVW